MASRSFETSCWTAAACAKSLWSFSAYLRAQTQSWFSAGPDNCSRLPDNAVFCFCVNPSGLCLHWIGIRGIVMPGDILIMQSSDASGRLIIKIIMLYLITALLILIMFWFWTGIPQRRLLLLHAEMARAVPRQAHRTAAWPGVCVRRGTPGTLSHNFSLA